MKKIQAVTNYQFTDNIMQLGDKAISTIITLILFAFLVSPFMLLIVRLS